MPRKSKEAKAGGAPRVFISSTAMDLAECRQQAKDAALRADLFPVLHEYWEAKDIPPYAECMDRVDQCQVLVAIVARRYGWEPPDQPAAADGELKSITWLECERAVANGVDVLAFLLEDKATWPPEQDENAAVLEALAKHDAGSPEFLAIAQPAQRRCRRLAAFKTWLQSNRIRATFTDARSLHAEVERALRTWREEHPQPPDRKAGEKRRTAALGAGYLDWVRRSFGSVDLLGLDSRRVRAPSLSSVYVPAVTTSRVREPNASPHELLLARLSDESLYIEGSAGAGKSTFCRWVAWLVANRELPPIAAEVPDPFREEFPAALREHVPVLIALRDAWEQFSGAVGQRCWNGEQLEHALEAWADQSSAGDGALSGAALRGLLRSGRALLILDGVDEVPISSGTEGQRSYPRDVLLSGLADARARWLAAGNRLLVTSRPDVLDSEQIAKLGLCGVPLMPMPSELQRLFVSRWFAATDPDRAADKAAGLLRDIDPRPELSELAGNPILLTALCICYSDGERLPEDQFLLYDRVVSGVLAHRYRDEAKEARPARGRLAAIALGMHTGSATGQPRANPSAEVPQAEIERILDDYAGVSRATEHTQNDTAQKLADLLSNSGLLVGRSGKKASFHHLSFQEFLAAEHIVRMNRSDDALLDLIRARAATAEWRRTLVHLFGALALRHRDEQWAVERLSELAREQTRETVARCPQPAWFLADCVDMAAAKGWFLGDLRETFTRICLGAIEDEIELHARARLALTLGRLGDPRPGVGLRADGLPDIAWVPIAAARVKVESETREVPAFAIARYPVTNAQFQAFVEAEDGYRNEAWWGGLERGKPVTPRWTEPNTPRVAVSWFEATAFCRWLSSRESREIRLPTEFEWQLAATGGDAAREYPWGAWREGMCNSAEAEIRRTSAVGIFPSATWSGGPLDMAGNVHQWCRDTPLESYLYGWAGRSVRGGSWLSVRFPSAHHGWCDLVGRDDIGFRPASSSLD